MVANNWPKCINVCKRFCSFSFEALQKYFFARRGRLKYSEFILGIFKLNFNFISKIFLGGLYLVQNTTSQEQRWFHPRGPVKEAPVSTSTICSKGVWELWLGPPQVHHLWSDASCGLLSWTGSKICCDCDEENGDQRSLYMRKLFGINGSDRRWFSF